MRPSERLTTLFLAAVTVLAIVGRPPSPVAALELLALAVATVLLARAAPKSRAGALLRDLFPIATVVAVFMLLEPVIVGVNPRRWDAYFSGFDARWFPTLVPAWRNAFDRAPAFTDLVYLAYVSYYALPIAVALLARRRGPGAYEGAVLAILLAFYGSFAGYVLFPTSGPRLSPADEARVVGGGAASEAIRAFLRVAERTRLDAFPSGHTAIALVSAAVGGRIARRHAAALLLWALAVVFSTVYVHVHYVVDVVAGAALAAAALAVAPAVGRALARRR
ncbi:MAG TPA: phosphatase PAP2 family protein [Anaeromyxobacter sp.]|nr:phosphatase PAP2 family protein [Anaeromyxobacter sp.]